MPGVGVAPGFLGLFSVLGSGIPGVGVAPFGSTTPAFAGGIPGVVFVDGAIGAVENSGGTFAALAFAVLFTATFEFNCVAG